MSPSTPITPITHRRPSLLAACAVLLLVLAGADVAAGAPQLAPTATCPADAVAELDRTIDFVRGQTWTDQPQKMALNISPDLNACRVVLNVGHLSAKEEAALQAGAGPRLAIEHRKDFGHPSRILLILWVVFGGSGLIWLYRRTSRL
jgi:hypothetical protein